MTTYFITRHKGAVEWARAQGITATQISHLDPGMIRQGDTVLGTLPVNIAAEICARGARYFHLSLDVPEALRGEELTAAQMQACSAALEEYDVREVNDGR